MFAMLTSMIHKKKKINPLKGARKAFCLARIDIYPLAIHKILLSKIIIPALRGDYGCPPGESKDVRECKEKDCDNIAEMRYVNCGAGYVF